MRDFHQRQEDAQDQSVWLVVLMVAAGVVTIIAFAIVASLISVVCSMAYMAWATKMTLPADYFAQVFLERAWMGGIAATLLVVGTACYRSHQLVQGGGRYVAQQFGGMRVIEQGADRSQKKLLHVVQEMAIAAGVRCPAVYVLESEDNINAFAAGTQEKDYVIGVTRGAIDRLTREQLQGIVAHELSHIVHSDTRLNVRLMGGLAGLQALSYVAARLIRMGWGTGKGGQGFGLGQILSFVMGCVVYPVGKIGEVLATLIKLAVNRQREFLADAKAVELTRNPHGLCEALQVILQQGSRVESIQAAMAGHLFFADTRSSWSAWLETHPPLWQRIRRLSDQASPSATTGGSSNAPTNSIC